MDMVLYECVRAGEGGGREEWSRREPKKERKSEGRGMGKWRGMMRVQ